MSEFFVKQYKQNESVFLEEKYKIGRSVFFCEKYSISVFFRKKIQSEQ